MDLETYLESFGQSNISLAGIEEVFGQLGGFEQSRSLMYYVQVLEKLENNDYSFNLSLLLDMLDNSDAFKAYLGDSLKGSAIDSVESLKHYAAGREYEHQKRPVKRLKSTGHACLSSIHMSVTIH